MNSTIMKSGIAIALLGTLAALPLLAPQLRPEAAETVSVSVSSLPAPDLADTKLDANQREYVYYPGGGFYYAPRTRTWFWPEGEGWAHGLSLPEQFWDASGYGVNIALETDLPYLEHEKVFAHYAELQQLIAYHEEASSL